MGTCEHCGDTLGSTTANCPKCQWWSEEVLFELLRHHDATVRAQAASDLVYLVPSEQIVLALAAALGDPALTVRQAAGLQLFICGRRAEPAVPALIEALDDPDVVVRRSAAAALSMVGRPARAALAKLAELRGAEDELLRVWVAEAESSISG